MRLSEMRISEGLRLFYEAGIAPFLITLVLSAIASLSGGALSTLFYNAVEGLLAITLFKLSADVSLIFLSVAFLLSYWRSRPWDLPFRCFHWLGDRIGWVAFITAGAAAGVGSGLFAGMAIEKGIYSAFVACCRIDFLFVAAAAFIWVFAVAPNHHFARGLPLGIMALLSVVMIIVTSSALYCEPWSEIKDLHLSRSEAVCRPVRWFFQVKEGTER